MSLTARDLAAHALHPAPHTRSVPQTLWTRAHRGFREPVVLFLRISILSLMTGGKRSPLEKAGCGMLARALGCMRTEPRGVRPEPGEAARLRPGGPRAPAGRWPRPRLRPPAAQAVPFRGQ